MPSNKQHPDPPADLSGLLVLDKPLGLTSMQAVAAVRRRAGGARTGHAGTLDPLATGVLVLAIGRATKLIDQFMATRKQYRTAIDLSAFTATDDAEGERQPVAVDNPPALATIAREIANMVGEIQQRPPAFSAVKIGGRRAYKLARQGDPQMLPPRSVQLFAASVLAYTWPVVEVELHTGKGFYVRSFARDLGGALGTGGHCISLQRTAVGPFKIEEAVTLDELTDQIHAAHLIPPDKALGRLVT